MLHVEAVFSMQLRSQACNSLDRFIAGPWNHGQEIDIRSCAAEVILLGDDKSTHAMQLCRLFEPLIDLPQERSPRLRRRALFSGATGFTRHKATGRRPSSSVN